MSIKKGLTVKAWKFAWTSRPFLFVGYARGGGQRAQKQCCFSLGIFQIFGHPLHPHRWGIAGLLGKYKRTELWAPGLCLKGLRGPLLGRKGNWQSDLDSTPSFGGWSSISFSSHSSKTLGAECFPLNKPKWLRNFFLSHGLFLTQRGYFHWLLIWYETWVWSEEDSVVKKPSRNSSPGWWGQSVNTALVQGSTEDHEKRGNSDPLVQGCEGLTRKGRENCTFRNQVGIRMDRWK